MSKEDAMWELSKEDATGEKYREQVLTLFAAIRLLVKLYHNAEKEGQKQLKLTINYLYNRLFYLGQ